MKFSREFENRTVSYSLQTHGAVFMARAFVIRIPAFMDKSYGKS